MTDCQVEVLPHPAGCGYPDKGWRCAAHGTSSVDYPPAKYARRVSSRYPFTRDADAVEAGLRDCPEMRQS
jgi:hypothetical protein